MNKVESSNLIPATESEKQAVREQLVRVLASSHFSHSKRYPAFLHYIVEQSLCGKSEDIKERSIGIEVFHRDADYETNTDPIVRVTAGAIRRRLQQYYYEPGREAELQIELPSGSYIPVFHVPENVAVPADAAPYEAPAVTSSAAMSRAKRFRIEKLHLGPRWARYAAAVAVLAVLVSSSFTYKQEAANNPLNQIWNPLIATNQTILLCVANARPNDFGENISLPDALIMNDVESTLKARKRGYQVIDLSTADLSKMGNGPLVFVGPYHTAAQLTQGLRYTFDLTENPSSVPGSPKTEAVIKDSLSSAQWPSEHSGTYDKNYAILARFTDKTLGRPVVLVSGETPAATTAASQLLTDAKYADLLASRAPSDWQKQNFEAVILTEAQNHQPGPPQIAAAYFWQ
jgi:hypothetical protein